MHSLARGGNRIDKIALLYYRDSSMYWVICYENRIKNPLILEAGTILRIPTSTDIQNKLLRIL